MRISILLLTLGLVSPAVAQDAPLSVIDWLNDDTGAIGTAERPEEPAVTRSGQVPTVAVVPLQEDAPRRVGLAPADVTGLPDDLWSRDPATDLVRLIGTVPALTLPAAQALYYTLLLAESDPPLGDATLFDLARIDALIDLGAVDPARALLEQAGPATSEEHFSRYLDLALLTETEDRACGILQAHPKLAKSPAPQVFCSARAGDWDTATLILGTAASLDLIDPPMDAALARFLDPDLFEGEPPLETPARPDPLTFRLFAAVGSPIPTRSLPRPFAIADLSDNAGWKAQIEAAERLSLTGALPGNQLLGVYTARQPAASGGIWDRVAAVQRFETALRSQNAVAVSKSLPTAWREMRKARLGHVFAGIFAEALVELDLDGAAADAAFEMMLLSPGYETAITEYPVRADERPVVRDIARGQAPDENAASSAMERAVAAGFAAGSDGDAKILADALSGRLGRALLHTLGLLQAGADGDVAQLERALATLRALGLEDTARRAALQVLLLEDAA